MKRFANPLATLVAAAFLFCSILTPALSAGIVTTIPSAASKLETQGNVVPSWALIQYLSQLQAGGAATYGSWTLNTVNNAAGTTITAGNMVGVLETRTGAAAVSDTTDTAANIIGAIPFATIGSQALWEIQNQNTGLLTLVGGTSVTLAGQTVVPINQTWIGQINVLNGNVGSATVTQQGSGYSSAAVPTVTISGSNCSGVTATATVPVGANYVSAITITAAGTLCTGVPTCTIGAPSATTPSIQATCTAVVVPTNVTITGYTTVPQASLPATQYTATASAGPAMSAGWMTGANYVILDSSGATAFTTRTATQLFADTPNAYVGETWIFRTRNSNAGTLTYTGGVGVTFATVSGANTAVTNSTRDHPCTFVTSTTVTCTNIGAGTF
jgi:hypothetical protein